MTLTLLLDLLIKSTLLLVMGVGIHRLSRRFGAATAHFFWVVTFAGLILLPLLAWCLPPSSQATLPTPVLTAPLTTEAPQPGPATSPRPVADPTTEAATVAPGMAPLELLVAIWLLGVALASVRIAWGLAWIARLRGRTYSLIEAESIARKAGLSRVPEIRLGLDNSLATAMTWGVLRPVVQLPVDAIRWSPQRLEAVLLHEFAHVRRRDVLSLWLCSMVCALYWFHPLVWLCARVIREEAESAADDAVLSAGISASTYAAELLGLAADSRHRHLRPAIQGVFLMSKPGIETRLRAILAPRTSRRGLTRYQILLTLTAAMVTLPALARVHAAYVQRSAVEISSAQQHLRALGLATMVYAQDYGDRLPSAPSTVKALQIVNPYIDRGQADEQQGVLRAELDKLLFDLDAAQRNSSADSANVIHLRLQIEALTKYPRVVPPFSQKGVSLAYNAKLSGVAIADLASPAEVPLWFEMVSDARDPFSVVFVDGHVQLFKPQQRDDFDRALRSIRLSSEATGRPSLARGGGGGQ